MVKYEADLSSHNTGTGILKVIGSWYNRLRKNHQKCRVCLQGLQCSKCVLIRFIDVPLVDRIAPPNSLPHARFFFHNFQPSATLVFLFPELCLYFIRNLLRVHLLSLLLFDLYPLLLSHALLKSPKMAGGNVVEIKS